jgi:hypothetical protein
MSWKLAENHRASAENSTNLIAGWRMRLAAVFLMLGTLLGHNSCSAVGPRSIKPPDGTSQKTPPTESIGPVPGQSYEGPDILFDPSRPKGKGKWYYKNVIT